jgi:hypothetical protein
MVQHGVNPRGHRTDGRAVARVAAARRRLQSDEVCTLSTSVVQHSSRATRWVVGLTGEASPHRGGGGGGGRLRLVDGGGGRWSVEVREVSCGTVEEGEA